MPRRFGRSTIGRLSPTDTLLHVFAGAFVLLFCAITLYPFWYVIAASVSEPGAIVRNEITLGPVRPLSVESYRLILNDSRIWLGYANTIFYAVFGTALNLVVTVLAAYPMSRPEFRGRRFMNVFVSITMFISATGMMIPLYLIVRGLNLLDTRLSLLVVFAAFPFFVILMRSFFETIPNQLIEAARIDGAGEWIVLLRVVLPVSGAALATIGLYYLINRWNGYFWAMVFLRDPNKVPLQVVLRQLIVLTRMGEEMDVNVGRSATNAQAITYATIVVATLPIAVIYPFIQKYFVKGITLGSVKG